MKLILLRHGETLFNRLGYTQGWSDSPLTEKGIEQARKAGETLKNYPIDAAYSSSSGRAYETTQIVLEGRNIEIKPDKRLRELSFGLFEGSSFMIQREVQRINNGSKIDYHLFNGENEEDVIKRYQDFFYNELQDDDKTTLLVGHGAALHHFVNSMWKEDLQTNFPDFRFFGNCTLMILEGPKEHLKVNRIIRVDD